MSSENDSDRRTSEAPDVASSNSENVKISSALSENEEYMSQASVEDEPDVSSETREEDELKQLKHPWTDKSKLSVAECGAGGNCGPNSFFKGLQYLEITEDVVFQEASTPENVRKKVAQAQGKLPKMGKWWNQKDLQHAANEYNVGILMFNKGRDSLILPEGKPIPKLSVALLGGEGESVHFQLVLPSSFNPRLLVPDGSVYFVCSLLECDKAKYSPSHLSGAGGLIEPLRRAFSTVPNILEMNFSSLEQFQFKGSTASERRAEALALTNHFANVNQHVIGPAAVAGLKLFAGVVGNTSNAKDVTVSQIVEKPEAAVSSEDMTTAANVFMSVVYNPDLTEDSYDVTYGTEHKQHKGGDRYKDHMNVLMERIRGGENNFDSRPIVVRLESATPVWPSYILNTIGFIPRSNSGDPIFTMLNDILNEEENNGGVLVICHSVAQPLDASAAWKDLDVVKKWISNRKECKMKVLLAITKADLKAESYYHDCHSMRDLYNKIFGRFEKLLPNTEMFFVTGWRENGPTDEMACAGELRQTIDAVKARIIQGNSKEGSSPWIDKLDARIGTAQLRKEYLRLIGLQASRYVDSFLGCLTHAIDTLDKKRRELLVEYDAVQIDSVSGPIDEICTVTEKQAMIYRTGALERPSSADVNLETNREFAAKYRKTLLEELGIIYNMKDFEMTVSLDDIKQIILTASTDIPINNRRYHSFWMRIERLKENSKTFAKLYRMEPLPREEIIDFITTKPVNNNMDVDNFVNTFVVDSVKTIFCRELGPLFSKWIAYMVYESYECGFFLSLRDSTPGKALKTNTKFHEIFLEVLKDIYFKDIEEEVKYAVLGKAPAFLERLNILRETQSSAKARSETEQNWLQRLGAISPIIAAKIAKYLKITLPSLTANTILPLSQLKMKENFAKPFVPSLYLDVTLEETQILNEIAQYYFEEMLVQCIEHFFREALARVDFCYSQTRYERDNNFLFKHFFMTTFERESSQFPDHQSELAKFTYNERYYGYTVQQLLEKGIIVFNDKNSYAKPDSKANDPSKRADDPFSDLRHTQNNLTLFSYKFPRSLHPGYRLPLHDKVRGRAKTFLGDVYNDKANIESIILKEAVQLRDLQLQLKAAKDYLKQELSTP
eukprot:TRINITY_DN179_c1_g1_i7.p1 TRINITY_DN179_c1_g1~~TRINITY_DN179_c1_g1_i7.p1  ORF type:complete len:1123 (+),score=133.99 TRINITY_DN179_c1_g1_i7:48-3416(+)